MPEIYHSQTKKAIQASPVSTRSAIASLEDHENARLVSFKTATIRNEPAIIKSDPIISRLANERYEARVRNEGVCWSRPKFVGIATMITTIAIKHNGALMI
jgi:hypothetical protein